MSDNRKITSPEQLNSYIRITTPGAWLVLASAAVFMLGFFAWIFFGELEIPNEHTTVKPLTFLLK
ncbi:MAG: hypothetical protein IJR85_02045 [Synergistaceae bacterium]|nr:hypothetical protein [Synergistaceae bacterium]